MVRLDSTTAFGGHDRSAPLTGSGGGLRRIAVGAAVEPTTGSTFDGSTGAPRRYKRSTVHTVTNGTRAIVANTDSEVADTTIHWTVDSPAVSPSSSEATPTAGKNRNTDPATAQNQRRRRIVIAAATAPGIIATA